MGSKHPSDERLMADVLILPPQEGTDNETPTTETPTKNIHDNHGSSGTTSVDCSATNASKQTLVPVSGSPRDIICGRGLHVMNHNGNFNLHIIVDRHRGVYRASCRKQKAAIIRHIVQQIKSTGARFLRRLNEHTDGQWAEADDATAYKKVGHALRVKKQGHEQKFLKYTVHRQQTSTSQNVAAAMSTSGPSQNTTSHLSRFSSSSSSLAMHLPLPGNQLQIMATQPTVPPHGGAQFQPTIVRPSAIIGGGGYAGRNRAATAIDPRLFAQAFEITLRTLTQLRQQQQPSTFINSFMDGQR